MGQGCDWIVEEVERKKPSEASDEVKAKEAWAMGTCMLAMGANSANGCSMGFADAAERKASKSRRLHVALGQTQETRRRRCERTRRKGETYTSCRPAIDEGRLPTLILVVCSEPC